MLPVAFSGQLHDQQRERRGRRMPSPYEKLKTMADECRKLAAMLETAAIRSRLLALAEHLEQWARETDRNGAGRS
jgi:hypothetical protein